MNFSPMNIRSYVLKAQKKSETGLYLFKHSILYTNIIRLLLTTLFLVYKVTLK